MKRLALLAFLLLGLSADALTLSENQFMAYAYSVGVDLFDGTGRAVLTPAGDSYSLYRWEHSAPAPTEDTLPTVEESQVIVREAQEAAAISAELAHQAAKPAARKTSENDFFALIRLVLTAASDPRASDVPTPKLGFEELTPMIEGIQATDPMTAINLTLKGLSIDSALKRYDVMWWDDAVEHEAQ